MGLEATNRAISGGAAIELRGDIDSTARVALAAAYDESAPTGRLLLDFERVAYIDSTGIALIVDLLARARGDGRSVAARGLSDHYREIFEITRIADFITILPDNDDDDPDDGAPRADEPGAEG